MNPLFVHFPEKHSNFLRALIEQLIVFGYLAPDFLKPLFKRIVVPERDVASGPDGGVSRLIRVYFSHNVL